MKLSEVLTPAQFFDKVARQKQIEQENRLELAVTEVWAVIEADYMSLSWASKRFEQSEMPLYREVAKVFRDNHWVVEFYSDKDETVVIVLSDHHVHPKTVAQYFGNVIPLGSMA